MSLENGATQFFVSCTMSENIEINFGEIEAYLEQFGGGEIILSKEYFDKGLAVIYFNNPSKKNALSGKMMVELRHCIDELYQWQDGKGVLLCGLQGNFCSGGDLDFARASGTPERALQMSSWMQDTLDRLEKLPMFSVCLVQGPTLGGGAEIAIHCDFIIAVEDVRFGFVHGRMGLITAWGGGTRLVQKIGAKKALNLLLTAQILTAQECRESGIADCVVPVDEYLAKAMEWIDLRLQHHPVVVRLFKQVVHKAATDTVENSLEYEKRLFSRTWGEQPNKEALAKNIKHVKLNTSKM